MEVYNAIREAVGEKYPVLIKINNVKNGLSLEDSVMVSKMLADAGIDAIELSGGTPDSGKDGLGIPRLYIKGSSRPNRPGT